MTGRRHTPNEIFDKVRDGERLLGEGHDLSRVLHELGISNSTWSRWRLQYGTLKAELMRRVYELERENDRLRRSVDEHSVALHALKEVLESRL